MKLKNILIAFSFLVVALGFYSLSERQQKSALLNNQVHELDITEYNVEKSNHSYVNNKRRASLNKRQRISSQKLQEYRNNTQKKSDSFEDTNQNKADKAPDSVKNQDENPEETEEEKTAENEEDKEDDENKDEKSTDPSEIAEEPPVNENLDVSNKENLKKYETFSASSRDDNSVYVGQNTTHANTRAQETTNQDAETEVLEDDSTEDTTTLSNQNGNTTDVVSNDDNNDRLAEVDLSTLEDLIANEDYSAIQNFVLSSSLSTFKRQALNVLISSSFDADSDEQRDAFEDIIESSYFNTDQLNLFTSSMVKDEYTSLEKGYMADLLIREVYSSPGRLSQTEFMDLYFNGIRSVLPTPDQVTDQNLADLYLSIDSAIEESFATYSTNSQIASDQ